MSAARSRLKARHWSIIVIAVACLIVLFQNAQVVSFRVFFWEISMSRIIAFPLLILFGVLIGFVLGKYSRPGSRR